MLINKVNEYIKKQIKKLIPKDRKDVIDFATFLGRQKQES